jgi:4-amino-4-deoxy-L-arabinose transferase-like glycosyltransferase
VIARLGLLAALTLAAGWLRFSATSFGLPDKFRPDEEYLVSRALGFSADWNPHFSVYPAAQMYLQHALLRGYARWTAPEVRDFRIVYAPDGAALAHLLGRRLSAAFGTANVPLIYWAAAPAGGPIAGFAAATLLAFSPIHVRESRYATTDAAAVFWLTLAMAFVLRMVARGRYRDYLGAGAFIGLATATKYPAGAMLAALPVAHLETRWRERRSSWRAIFDLRLYAALYFAVVVFVCGTPYFLIDWKETVQGFEYQRGFVLGGTGNPYSGYGWPWLLFRAMPDGFGLGCELLFAAGLVWALARRHAGALALAAFLALACLGMTRSHYVFYRYIVIPLPALVVLAGSMVGDLCQGFGRRGAVLAIAILAGVLAPAIVRDVKLIRLLRREDTRSLARKWIVEHVPRGARIAASDARTPYGKPQLPLDYQLVPLAPTAELRAQKVNWILADSSPLRFYSPGPSAAELAELDRDATLLFDVDPVKPGAPDPVFDAADAFYAPLRHIASMSRPGPRIRVWRLKPMPPSG